MRTKLMVAAVVVGVVVVGWAGSLTRSPVSVAPSNHMTFSASGDGGSVTRAGPAAPAAQFQAPNGNSLTVDSTAPQQASLPLGDPQGQQIERSVAAAYVVPHDQFLPSFNAVVARAVSLGGYVDSSSTSPDESGKIVSGTITVKIPQAKLSDLLSGLPGDFETSSINFTSVDHTAQYVDLNAQISSAKAHHAVLLKLLAQASGLDQIVQLDDQIAQVETQINRLQGQLDQMTHAVAYSTAAISLKEKGITAVVTPTPSPWEPLWNSIKAGLGNARDVVAAGLLSIISVLPLLVTLGLGMFIFRRRLSGLRHSDAAAPVTPVAD